jgi:glyoxylase-like metal-dependent hydrolase (beta-lactamase superfamily II)
VADSITIGNVTIHVILDMIPPPREPESFFPDVSLEQWEPYKTEHLDTNGKFQLNYCAAVVRSPERMVLIDTGLGPGPHERFNGMQGHLLERLREIGISPEDISTVVTTHLHGDHVGWNISEEGGRQRATFPRAKYLAPKADWDYFTRPEILQSQPVVQNSVLPLQTLGVLELIEGDHAVTPEITTLSAPGHTPGHLAIVVRSQGQTAMIVGDLFHNSAQVTEPDWHPRPDIDKELASRTRTDVLDRLEREGCLVIAWHIPRANGIGKVVRVGGRRVWQPL